MAKSFAQNKGARFEREFCKIVQSVVDEVYDELGLEERPRIERNQNQSAVGGYDLVGVPSLAIELKHQEVLSVDKWFEQCVRATRSGQISVLAYKQNNVRVRVEMFGYVETGKMRVKARVNISLEAFKIWLKQHIIEQVHV